MNRLQSRAAGCCVLLVGLVAAGPASKPATRPWRAIPTTQQISEATRELGADDFEVRERASRWLWSLGNVAVPALEKAAKSDDAETAARAAEVLGRLRSGVTPLTPAEIAEQLNRYNQGDVAARKEAIAALAEKGAWGMYALARLRAGPQRADLKEIYAEIDEHFKNSPVSAAQALVANGDVAGARRVLLRGFAEAEDSQIGRQLAAFLTLRGQSDAILKDAKELGLSPSADAHLRIYLLRASGDLKGAMSIAQQQQESALIVRLLLELGDWQALAEKIEKDKGADDELKAQPTQRAARLLSYWRRAGNAAKAKQYADLLLLSATASPEEAVSCARAYLLNDRAEAAIGMLIAAGQYTMASELFEAQGRYDEALKLLDRARQKPDEGDLAALEVHHPLVLHRIGKTQEAARRWRELAKDAKYSEHLPTIARLEREAGLVEAALDHAAMALADASRHESAEVLGGIFGAESGAAAWYEAMRQIDPNQERRATLARVHDIYRSKMPADRLKSLANDCAAAAAELAPEAREQDLDSIVKTLQILGHHDAAQQLAEKIISTTPSHNLFLRLGDMAARNKGWIDAAGWYRQAMQCLPTDAIATYLCGWATVQAGHEKEGRELIALAELLPLGEEDERLALAQALSERKIDGSVRQCELTTRLGDFSSLERHNAAEVLARDAITKGDHFRGAALFEQSMLECLGPAMSYSNMSAYLGVPAFVHRTKAMGYLKAGDADRAVAEAKLAIASSPQDIDLVHDLAPALEQAGRKADADKFTGEMIGRHAALARAYPESGHLHNNYAWLLAKLKRDLDTALTEASKAVELEPQSAAYIDTLAEVYFQRGEKQKAIAQAKRAIEVDPQNPYLREQLARFGK